MDLTSTMVCISLARVHRGGPLKARENQCACVVARQPPVRIGIMRNQMHPGAHQDALTTVG